MTTKQAAIYLGISTYYLRNMRQLLHRHDGPKFSMVPRPKTSRGGLQCEYNVIDLDQWKREHKWKKIRTS